jgi:hypothetical protein
VNRRVLGRRRRFEMCGGVPIATMQIDPGVTSISTPPLLTRGTGCETPSLKRVGSSRGAEAYAPSSHQICAPLKRFLRPIDG